MRNWNDDVTLCGGITTCDREMNFCERLCKEACSRVEAFQGGGVNREVEEGVLMIGFQLFLFVIFRQ